LRGTAGYVPHASETETMPSQPPLHSTLATGGTFAVMLAAATIASLSSRPAFAQDLVAVAPDQAKVEYEDARVRIVRLRIPENASLPTHDRPRRVVVSLTANHVRLVRADGTTSVTRTEGGSVAWSEPAVRAVANLGGPVENVVIELKQAAEPAVPVDSPPVPSDRTLDDRLHRWSFENQYVRVYEVRIPPGQTTTFHRHAYDQVSVFVSGGLVSTQIEGKPWTVRTPVRPHAATYSPDAAMPVVHRVRNDGNADYRVVLVQLLR
jgi:hypothetical protein